MTYEEYLSIKEKNRVDSLCENKDCVTINPWEPDNFVIKNEDDYKKAKKAIETYEEDNFEVTYDDFDKLDRCFNETIKTLQYKDNVDDESYLERIVAVMRFLDWNYAGNKEQYISESMLLDTVINLFHLAMNGIVNSKSKTYQTSTGGWTIYVNLETYYVSVYFSLFDDTVFYDEINERIGHEF